MGVRVLGSLVDTNGKIQIPGLSELVAPLTEEEQSLYGNIAFTMDNLYEPSHSQVPRLSFQPRLLESSLFAQYPTWNQRMSTASSSSMSTSSSRSWEARTLSTLLYSTLASGG